MELGKQVRKQREAKVESGETPALHACPCPALPCPAGLGESLAESLASGLPPRCPRGSISTHRKEMQGLGLKQPKSFFSWTLMRL